MKPTIKLFALLFIFAFNKVAVLCQLQKDYVVQLETSISEDPISVSFAWNIIPGDSEITIRRKIQDSLEWDNPIATLPADAIGYIDSDIEVGVIYEYEIRKQGSADPIITYVSAGVQIPEIENRGKVLLLVDSSFVDSLRKELMLYETDLISDGWDVVRKDISRGTSVKYVKSVIRDFYDSDTINAEAVILFGHIPIPYSGCYAGDVHPEHFGAYPADIYYGAMDETIWTDETANCTQASWIENHNLPGDGKFDVGIIPENEIISLQIGRVDFYDLPAFQESEAELLRNYLQKNFKFRHKINNSKQQALMFDQYGSVWPISQYGWRFFSALFDYPNVNEGSFFPGLRSDSYTWSMLNGGGAFDWCNDVSTSDFVKYKAKTVFMSIDGSYMFDWGMQNSIMRASLASKGWTLNCMTGDIPYYLFHRMGMGETVGSCIRATSNEINYYDHSWPVRDILTDLLGDPTLRMHIVCPPNTLQAAVTEDSTVLLAWKPADDSIIGYHVYKLDTLTNNYNRITTDPVTDTWYEDTLPASGNNYYMVKSYQLTQSASGSYYNLSQGVFDTLNYQPKAAVSVDSIELYLASSNLLPLMLYDPVKVNAMVWPDSATNKLLKWSVENISANGKLDVEGNILSDKGGVLVVKAEALDGSGISGNLEISIDSIPDKAEEIAGDTASCRNYGTLLFTVPEIRGAESYLWTLPDGETRTTVLNELNYLMDDNAESGDIRVKGHNPYADGLESTLHLTVYEKPSKPEITWNGTLLQSTSTEGNQWYLGGLPIEGATEQTYVPTEEGNYTVKVTLNNCVSNISDKIAYPVGLKEENLTRNIRIFPNPAIGELTIEFEKEQSTSSTIALLDISGKVVYSATINPGETQHQINLSSFEEGLYLIRINNSDYTVTKKVIKVE